MKLRTIAAVAALAFATLAAQAQIGVGPYFNPAAIRVSNSSADAGPFAFLGPNSTSQVFYGYNYGGYWDFFHSGSIAAGFDLRESDLHANNALLRSFMLGARVSAKPFNGIQTLRSVLLRLRHYQSTGQYRPNQQIRLHRLWRRGLPHSKAYRLPHYGDWIRFVDHDQQRRRWRRSNAVCSRFQPDQLQLRPRLPLLELRLHRCTQISHAMPPRVNVAWVRKVIAFVFSSSQGPAFPIFPLQVPVSVLSAYVLFDPEIFCL